MGEGEPGDQGPPCRAQGRRHAPVLVLLKARAAEATIRAREGSPPSKTGTERPTAALRRRNEACSQEGLSRGPPAPHARKRSSILGFTWRAPTKTTGFECEGP